MTANAALPGAEENTIFDCSRTGRFGLRGPGTLDWLASEGLTAPQEVNTALTQPSGISVLRLGQQEVLLTAPAGSDGERIRALCKEWKESALPAKGYDAYRDEGWAWFVISGPVAPQMMARISMADLRPERFQPGQIAQTRALQQDAVVVRSDRFGAISYDIFFDIASASFSLEVLTETADGIGADFTITELRGEE